MHGCYVLFHTQ